VRSRRAANPATYGADVDQPEGVRLLRLVANGDKAALGAFYDLYAGDVFGVALRMLRDRSLAEDAMQETFISVWRNAAHYRPEIASMRTWVVMVARRRAIDILRNRRSRAVELELDQALLPVAGTDVWTDVARLLDQDSMATLLARLPAEQRTVIELAFMNGLSHVEIAHETGATLGTVKGRARLGLRAIRRMAIEDDVLIGDASPGRYDAVAGARISAGPSDSLRSVT
jgi:RNA polymerase sigma-70 factor, ECF subfamily